MARNMMIIAVCDGCGIRGAEEDFKMDVIIDVPTMNKKPVETDLCTDEVADGQNCYGRFVAAVTPWLEKARVSDASTRIPKPERKGSRVPRPASAGEADPSLVCDVEGCIKGPKKGPYIAPTPMGLKMHKVRSHGAPKSNGHKKR